MRKDRYFLGEGIALSWNRFLACLGTLFHRSLGQSYSQTGKRWGGEMRRCPQPALRSGEGHEVREAFSGWKRGIWHRWGKSEQVLGLVFVIPSEGKLTQQLSKGFAIRACAHTPPAVCGIPPGVFPSAGKVLVVIWECNPLLLRVLHSEVENVTLFQILLCHIDYSGPGEGQGDLYQHKLRVPAALTLCRKPLELFSLAGNIQWS